MDLTVIVITWNTREDLRNCLNSLSSEVATLQAEVIVADCSSEDGTADMVRTDFPWVTLVAHKRNLGFSRGNNRAIPDLPGRYVLFLNADTLVTPGALAELVRFADSEPRAGIIAPKLLNRDGSLQYSCRSFPDLGAGFFRNTPLGRLFPNNRYAADYMLSNWDHESVRDVDWVSGAALMIRRDVLATTRGFDEGFFMYCEDVDLCYRVHKLGLQVLYYPHVAVTHLIGRSSDHVPTRSTWYHHAAMYRFYRKHYAASTPLYVRPIIIPGLALRAVGKLVRYRLTSLRRQLSGRKRL